MDALVIAVASMGLILLGVRPFVDVDDATTVWDLLASIALALADPRLRGGAPCSSHRLLHATLGFFVAPLAVYSTRYGSASPTRRSRARRYGAPDGAEAHARPRGRFRRRPPDRAGSRSRFRDAVGGSTDEQYRLKLAGRG